MKKPGEKSEAPPQEQIERLKLRGCVHCGEQRRIEHMESVNLKCDRIYWIFCRHCGSSGPHKDTLEEAARGWNARFVA